MGVFLVISYLVALISQTLALFLASRLIRVAKPSMGKAVLIAFVLSSCFALALLLQVVSHFRFILILGIASIVGLVWILKAMLKIRAAKAVLLLGVALPLNLVLGIPTVFIQRVFVQAFKNPASSMSPTIYAGDRFLVNKMAYYSASPQRWDLAVFDVPGDPKRRRFIKRVVGLPGETVEIRDGGLWINGQPAQLPSELHGITWNNAGEYGQPGKPVQVPADSYFILSDNSASSRDSRHFGFVPRSAIVGKAMFIYWPPNRLRALN